MTENYPTTKEICDIFDIFIVVGMRPPFDESMKTNKKKDEKSERSNLRS